MIGDILHGRFVLSATGFEWRDQQSTKDWCEGSGRGRVVLITIGLRVKSETSESEGVSLARSDTGHDSAILS